MRINDSPENVFFKRNASGAKLERADLKTNGSDNASQAESEENDALENTGNESQLEREERISIAIDKTRLGLCDLGEDALMVMIGQTLGTAIAFTFLPTTIPNYLGILISNSGLSSTMSKIPLPSAASKGLEYAYKKTDLPVLLGETQASSRVIGASAGAYGAYTLNRMLPEKSFDEKRKDDAVYRKEHDDDTENQELSERNCSGSDSKKGIVDFLAGGVATGAKTMRAFPKFVYPSIQNASLEEEAVIIDALDKIPLKDVTRTSSISISDTLRQEREVSGVAYNLGYDTPIKLTRESMSRAPHRIQKTVIHEVGHAKDNRGIFRHSLKKPWGEAPFISNYARTNHKEDFAETYAYLYEPYHRIIGELTAPEKLRAMEEIQEPTMYDVIMDRKEVRDAGKFAAKTIDKVPGLRLAMTLAGQVLGPLTMTAGSRKLKSGIALGDKDKEFNGKMDVAQGIAFMTGVFAPAGLGIKGLQWAVNRRVKKGKMTSEQANKIGGTVLASSAGPPGLILHAAARGLTKTPETRSTREFMFEPKKSDTAGERLKSIIGVKNYNIVEADTRNVLTKEDTGLTWGDRFFIAKVGIGATGGGAVGTAAGFISGEIVGAVIGGAVAGPPGALTGAFIGKVGGSLIGAGVGSNIGAQAGRMLDKKTRNDDIASFKQYINQFDMSNEIDNEIDTVEEENEIKKESD
jgi:hypothetical protein